MKLINLALLTTLAASGSAFAATNATWSASGGSDPGTDGWTQDLTGTGGWFQGNSANNAGGTSGAGAGDPAWGFWSNDGGLSAGVWNLAGGGLTVGQTMSLDFDNGWIDSNGVGVQFRSGNNVSVSVYLNSGGPGYEIENSTGIIDSGQAFTGDGFTVTVALTGSGTYDLSFLGYSGSGSFANSATTVDNIRVYSFDPTGTGDGSNYDVYTNNITVVPEPAAAAMLGLLGTALLLRRRRF